MTKKGHRTRSVLTGFTIIVCLIADVPSSNGETGHAGQSGYSCPVAGTSADRWPAPDPLVETMTFPAVFDWRVTGGMTPVKDQGMTPGCYPCWAFSLIGAAESAFLIATGIPFSLSEQHLIECNTSGYGCSGGFIDGWTALRDYGAVLSEDYPFTGGENPCSQETCEPVGWVAGAYPVPYSIPSLKYALMVHGCLSCSMTVYSDFMMYSGGCYANPGTKSINHGVVLVGWDDTLCDGAGAWLVRNSWGDGWGDGGVAAMQYGTANIGRHAQWFEVVDEVVPRSLHYRLFMPDTALSAGDRFILESRMGNPTAETIDCLEFIVLDIAGDIWFHPGWTRDVQWDSWMIRSEEYRYHVLLAFDWPPDIILPDTIRFAGACFDAITFELLAWDLVTWHTNP
ncbi:hypothetical protein JXA80_14565 [bacterium]|nr:hypothetical protein [candidate division CSSED10-310 bacterium]